MINFNQLPLHPDLLKSLKTLDFISPTPVQMDVIPLLLDKKNLIVRANTGSGKTAAFGIPIIENIEWIENHPQALIIAPNRELVIQIAQDINLIGRYKRIKALPIYGRDSIKAQTLALKQKNHVIVATPGRLMDLIERGVMKLDKLKYFILDEGDELLRPEFMKQLESTFNILPPACCISLFSATITESIKHLQGKWENDFTYVDVSTKTLPEITEYFYELEESEKFNFLIRQLSTFDNQGGIIFAATKSKVENLCRKLSAKGYSAIFIHSDLEQRNRIRNMNGFKDGTYTYLVATDLSSRGIDVDGIDLVINYDLPVDIANYTHRIGRIGRNGEKGTALSFVSSEQKSLVPKIEGHIKRNCTWEDSNFDLQNTPHKIVAQNSIDTKRIVKGSNTGLDITKLYINGGKRKKLRAVDIVGTICSIPTIDPDDIGIIEIKENETYVEIMNGKYNLVLNGLRERTIKGRAFKVHKAK